MLRQGMPEAEVEERVYLDTMTFDVVKQWRTVHFPIIRAFVVLALALVFAYLHLMVSQGPWWQATPR
jgi:membrane protein YdbS with pleckstrin-like domain